MSGIIARARRIKIPIFKSILYSGLGYLGYCFYQDYKYKQLLQQISTNHKQSTKKPTKTLSSIAPIIQSLHSCTNRRQFRIYYKDLQKYFQEAFIDPYKSNIIVDFKLKQNPKSQDQKKFWWMNSYSQIIKIWNSIYFRQEQSIDGTFAIAFWYDIILKQNNAITQTQHAIKIIQQALKLRNHKCQYFALHQQNHSVLRKDQEMLQCLSQTQNSVVSLQKIKQRLAMIEKYQRNY